MPLPLIPLLLGGAALASAGYGVKKGIDAKDDFEKAERIGKRAKRRHEEAVEEIEKEREITNQAFINLGKLKIEIFSNQINQLIQEAKKRKPSKASLKNFEHTIEGISLPEMEKMVVASAELGSGALSGVASGAVAGFGAYGAVGTLATASTGTAIGTLSGAAATNATLAWLGGGALSAGGLGMAGGTAVLGGIVAGPAIAALGFVMATQAEKALSQALDYSAEVDTKIASIEAMKTVLVGLQANAHEMGLTLKKLTLVFDQALHDLDERDESSFSRLLAIGGTLKKIMDMPIITKEGQATPHLKDQLLIEVKNSGVINID